MSLIFIRVLIILLFAGCAINRKVSYDEIQTNILINNEFSYSIACHDQREVVLDGSRDEKFVGYMRSGISIAYPIGTESGKNFSDVFSVVINNSLKDSSNNTQIIKTNYTDSKQSILNQFKDSKRQRLILFTISKWRTDSKPNGLLYATEVIWDFSLEIYDNNEELLVSHRIHGINPDLDKGMGGSVKRIQKIVNEKFKEKLDLMFADPEIKKALILD